MTIITAGSSSSTPTITKVQDVTACNGGAASVTGVLPNVKATDFIAVSVPMPAGLAVFSVNDSLGNRYIQSAVSQTSGGAAELWTARGCVGGNASVTVVFAEPNVFGDYDYGLDTYDNASDPYDEGAGASVCVNIAEYAGVWWVAPQDMWGQNTSVGTTATAQTVTPRQGGDLFLSVVSTGASISGPSNGYTALNVGATGAANGRGAAYMVSPYVNAQSTSWGIASSQTYAVCHACFLAGPSGINPLLQFPEVEVQVSEDSNFLNFFSGTATFTSISSYVESFTSNYGRQHELDRINSGSTSIVVNNRDATFNPWNVSSFLYPGGLDPMSPIRIIAAWAGVTYPVAFSYLDSVTPNIVDALNVNATLNSFDVLKLLSLKYLSSNPLAAAILSGQ